MATQPGGFTAVVSLGGDCTGAVETKRFFAGRKTVSPFDYLVTPFDALLKVFDDDGAQFGIDFHPVHGAQSVQCERYGVLYHHEFSRADDETIRFNARAIAAWITAAARTGGHSPGR